MREGYSGWWKDGLCEGMEKLGEVERGDEGGRGQSEELSARINTRNRTHLDWHYFRLTQHLHEAPFLRVEETRLGQDLLQPN